MTDDFRHRTSLEVRFRDVDAFGHVNNAVFFSYVEHARVRYLIDLLRPERFDKLPLILARVEVDYRSPIRFDELVTVRTRVDWIGTTSFAMRHRMTVGADERVAAEVASVLVAYDYEAERPMRVPESWRASMRGYEGRDLRRPSVTDAGRTTAGVGG